MKIALHILQWLSPILDGALIGLFAMTIHECGLLLAASFRGVRVKSVAFHGKGLFTLREAGPLIKNRIVSIAGPLVNAIVVFTWNWSPMVGLADACFSFFQHPSDKWSRWRASFPRLGIIERNQ